MKEISIEEKAKRYDEAIERAKSKIKNDKDHVLYEHDIIELFPELKESEDEMIKKALLDFLENELEKHGNEEWDGGFHTTDVIAWLEKQKVLTTEEDLQGKEDVLWCIKQAKKHAKDENEMGTCWFAEKWLEKQGEQKTIDEIAKEVCKDKASAVAFLKSAGIMNEKGELAEQYRQDEQKHVDKVKPKFNVDDWVIDSQGIVHQISNVIENVTNHTYSYDIVGGGYFNDNTEGVRLWTIQDAKDGDVLCCESGWTCIFKALDNYTNTFSSYCFMDKDKWFCNTGSECHTLNKEFTKVYNGEIKPATKEQRDLLFQKMKEAGYVWDSEKKELKKIEQKPQRMVSAEAKEAMYDKSDWSEEVENNILFLTSIIEECFKDKEKITLHSDTVCAHFTKEDVIGRLKSLKDRVQLKQEWSEEDEKMLNTVIHNLRYPGVNYYKKPIEEKVKWLKSLKDRVQPQQEQKWSDVDKDILFRTIDNLKFLKDTISTDPKYAINIIDIEREITWLKSLRPQNKYTYNPYKEVVKSIADMCNHYGSFGDASANDFINNIRVKCKDAKEYDKLFTQSTWKPSEEQIKAVRLARSFVTDDFDENPTLSDVLVELEKQLKKLREE